MILTTKYSIGDPVYFVTHSNKVHGPILITSVEASAESHSDNPRSFYLNEPRYNSDELPFDESDRDGYTEDSIFTTKQEAEELVRARAEWK